MLLGLFLLLCVSVFPVQLGLCLRCRKRWIPMIPLVLILAFLLGCCLLAMPELRLTGEEGRLAAVVALFIGCFVLAADGLAWLIWGIVKLIQKAGK